MADDYDEILIEVDASKWNDPTSNSETSADLSPDSWMSRLLRTKERVYRVNVCVADADTKTIKMVDKHLNGLGLSLLRVDAVEARVHCFLAAIVRSPDQIHACLKQIRNLLEDIMEPKDLAVTYADVTFLSSGWTTYP